MEATIGLPTGLTITPLKTQQSNRVNITGAVTGTYILGVNGSVVSYTYVTGNTTQTIRDALKSAINGDALISNVVLAADIGTDALSLTATVSGTPFSVQIGGTAGATNMSNAITAANTNRITIGGTVNSGVASGSYTYTVSTTAGGACASPASLSGTINVSAASSITLSSLVTTTSQIVCMNTAIATITYTITGASSATVIPPTGAGFNGLPNGVNFSFDSGTKVLSISGSPNTTDTLNAVYTYTVVTADVDSGCATATIVGTITVTPLAGGIINGGINQTFCQDPSNLAIVPTALSVTGSTAAASGIQYQWQSSLDSVTWNNITGQTAVGYTVPSISVTTYYRRLIRRVSGSPSVIQCELPSSVHKIEVFNIDVGQIAMPTQICYGTVPDPFVNVRNATSSNGTLSYQWQYSPNNNAASWVDIANATSNSYAPPGALIEDAYYRRQVLSSINDQLNRVSIDKGSPTNPNDITISIDGIATSITTGTSSGTYANLLIAAINANGAIPVTASQTVSGVIDLVHDTPGTAFTLLAAPTFTTVTDSSPVSCSKNSPSIMIQVVDEILKANTNNDQTICYNTIPVDISATGFTPVAPAPNIGAITYQWYGSTDNAAFTALGAGYNGVTTNILDPQTALTQTNYYKLTTTNTYPIYQVQRFTVSGSGSAINETYTLTDGTTTATFTTVVTVTSNNAITSGIVSAINNRATLNAVIEAYDYQDGTIDIRGKVAGTAITVTTGSGGGASATFSGLSVLKSTTATCTVDSEVTTVIVSPLEVVTHISGDLIQTICERRCNYSSYI